MSKLGEYLTVKHGWAFKGEYFSEQGTQSILTPGNFYEKGGFKRTDGKDRYYIGEYPDEYLAHRGDLIVAMTEQAAGLLGSTAIVPEDNRYLHNQRVGLITCSPQLEKMYAYYLFMTKSVREQIARSASGTKVKHTSPEKIYDVEVSIPDIETQKKVSTLLWAIEEKISRNILINDNLWQTISTIYDYWFIQFDFPNAYGKPYRTAGGELIWNDKIKRAIPSGWTIASIISNPLTQVIKPGVEEFVTKEYLATAAVSGTSIASGSIIEYVNREGRANMQPTINSVWFAKMKNSIKHLFLNEEMAPIIDSAILSTGFCGLQCTEKSFEYVSSFISNPRFEIIKDILAHGATQEAVNNDDMESIPFIIPSDEILEQYHAATKDMFAQISQNICENRELFKVRDWLLPMLMNGQATIVD